MKPGYVATCFEEYEKCEALCAIYHANEETKYGISSG
jgi:hypothetical protein